MLNAKKSIPVLLLIVFTLIFFWKLLTFSEVFFFTDIRDVYLPLETFYSEQIRSGIFPLWSQYLQNGFPVFASDQIGVLYPPNFILRLIFPPHVSFNLIIVLHYFLAAWFTYLFARKLGVTRLASTMAGIIFAFGGFMMGHIVFTNIIIGAVWFPLLLFLAEYLIEKRRIIYALLIALLLGMIFLAGQPQLPVMMVIVFTLYFAYRLFGDREKLRKKKLLFYAGSYILLGILTISIAVVQLAPLLELVPLTPRSEGLVLERAYHYSFPPTNLVLWLFPNFFGTTYDYWGTDRIYEEVATYVGLGTLILAAFSLFFIKFLRQKRIAVFFIALSLLAIIFAFGKYSPLRLLGIETAIPLFRAPARLLVFVEFSLALLAAFGLDALIRYKDKILGCKGIKRFSRGLYSAAALVIAGVVAANILLIKFKDNLFTLGKDFLDSNVIGTPGNVFAPEYYYEKLEQILKLAGEDTVMLTNPRTWLALIIFVLFIAIFHLWTKNKLPSSIFRMYAVALIVIDIFLFGFGMHETTSAKQVFTPPSSAQFILNEENDNLFRTYPIPDQEEPEGLILGLPKTPWGEVSERRMNLLEPATNQRFHVSGVLWMASLNVFRHGQFMDLVRNPPSIKNLHLLSLMNVKYVLAEEYIDDPDISSEDLELVYDNSKVKIYRNNTALPRIFMASSYEIITDESAIKSRLGEEDFNPPDTIILEKDPNLTPVTNLQYQVSNISYSDQIITTDVDTSAATLLFLSDTWYPGWKAYVDGNETEIYRANFVFRSIVVPEGKHTVTFSYEPTVFYRTAWISMAALVITLLTITYLLLFKKDEALA